MPKFTLLLLILLPLTFSPARAQGDCGLETRLIPGDTARVTPGDANNLRVAPSPAAQRVGQIPGGGLLVVVDGPECAAGFTWWQVEFSADGELLVGWTVESSTMEYFIEAFADQIVSFQGISFILPPAVASSAQGREVEAEEPTEEEPWNHLPAYVEFTFEGYPDEDYGLEYEGPRVRVYQADAFAGIDNMLGGAGRSAIEGLADVLAEQPDLHEFAETGNRIPDDTPGAANLMLARLDYMNFQNGSGYRYITLYAQDFAEANNTRLIYRYLGLTGNGGHFVSAWFPIDSPQLPEPFDVEAAYSDEDGGAGAIQAYWVSAIELFDSIPPQDYTPDLSQLDVLIVSLTVERL